MYYITTSQKYVITTHSSKFTPTPEPHFLSRTSRGTSVLKPVNQTKYQSSMRFLYAQYKLPPTHKWCVCTCGGGHRSALALQSICAHISQEECMAVKCRYNIFTYATTEYSQARKCTYKHWGMIRRYILDSSQTHNLTNWVSHFALFTTVYTLQNYYGLLILFSEKNSSLHSYVDFATVIFISHTWPQNFNVLK